MGTTIELRIGDVILSLSKNFKGRDYGFLFQEADLSRQKVDSINYSYFEDHPELKEELAKAEEIFARPLSRILPRLQVLGFTLETARAEYESLVTEAIATSMVIDSEADESTPEFLTFEEFCNLACRYSLNDLKNNNVEGGASKDGMLLEGKFAADIDLFSHVPINDDTDFYWSEASFISAKLCILSAESMLQVFSMNEANAEVEVKWEFGPIVYAGWAQREEFQPGAKKVHKVLVATEGASDARIIRKALDILRPDVADFFNFVNVDERHHFWGATNLVKFAEGLIRIDLLNKVLFVFDNDAEGIDAFQRLKKLQPPANMRAMSLPDLEEFMQFNTSGPDGEKISDINGRAAAIECYLDLCWSQSDSPRVIWSNFKRDISAWHGELERKSSYSKVFFDRSDHELKNNSYDVSKLLKLVDELIAQAGLLSPVI